MESGKEKGERRYPTARLKKDSVARLKKDPKKERGDILPQALRKIPVARLKKDPLHKIDERIDPRRGKAELKGGNTELVGEMQPP